MTVCYSCFNHGVDEKEGGGRGEGGKKLLPVRGGPVCFDCVDEYLTKVECSYHDVWFFFFFFFFFFKFIFVLSLFLVVVLCSS